jgi:ABC-type multidrug transport system fused ATPase/permease subunit
MSSELRWMVHNARPLFHFYGLSLICIAGGSFLTLLDPLVMRWLIDVVLPRGHLGLVGVGTLGFAIIYCGRLALTYAGSLISFIAAQKLIFRIRLGLLRALDTRAARFHESLPLGEMLYRLEQDVSRVGELGGDVLPNIIRMFLVALMVVITMCILNVRLTSLVLPLLPIFYLLRSRCRNRLAVVAEATQAQSGRMSSILQEHLFGILQLQLLNCTGLHARKYALGAADGARALVRQKVAETRFGAASMLMVVAGSTLILGYGGYEVVQGRLTVGGLVAFFSYVTRLFEPLSIAVDLQSRMQRVTASIRRILEISGQDGSAEPSVIKCRVAKEMSARLEFHAVSFCHRRNVAVLNNLCLRVDAGEKVALVGPSGCGKSTIAHLAAGLYYPDVGSISINSQNIQFISRRNLRSIVSLVPQEPILFDATLRENLLYGDPDASDRDLESVLIMVQLEHVVRALPRGLDESLGPRGQRLSGGERKRVALARAMLQQPKLLILDELTSALDGPTSMGLLHSLERFRQGRTVVVISHRPSTICWADRIFVLDKGGIVDQGAHTELIQRCVLYQELLRDEPDMNVDALERITR